MPAHVRQIDRVSTEVQYTAERPGVNSYHQSEAIPFLTGAERKVKI